MLQILAAPQSLVGVKENIMSDTQKLLIGIALGFFGYVAYKKLKSTQTVYVDSFDQVMPNVSNIV